VDDLDLYIGRVSSVLLQDRGVAQVLAGIIAEPKIPGALGPKLDHWRSGCRLSRIEMIIIVSTTHNGQGERTDRPSPDGCQLGAISLHAYSLGARTSVPSQYITSIL